MRSISIGLSLAAEDLSNLFDVAEFADRNRIDYLWMADSQLRFRDAFVALAGCASKTTTVKLGTAVTNPVTRHYTVLAGAIATLDELSNRRAALGIGRGYTTVRTIGKKPSNIGSLRRSVQLIRALLRGEIAEDAGVKMKLFEQCSVPIYIAASGPATLKLAGEIGDGVFLRVGAQQRLLRHAVDKVRDAALEAGRSSEFPKLVAYVDCCISNNKEKGLKAVKYMVSSLLASAGSTILSFPEDVTGLTTAQLKELRESLDISKLTTDKAGFVKKVEETLSDQAAEKLTVVGSPSHCAERLGELAETGVTQLCLNLQPREERLDQLKMLVEEVLPSL